MNTQKRPAGIATPAQRRDFSEIIDTRSPAEFAADHIPGAINCPALDDAERAEIGTLYKQVSAFAARRRGAALVARNIAQHLLERFQDRGRDWRPLIYCWRGGKRSESFVTVFRQIGWDAHQLAGGYKAYRREVLEALESLPAKLSFCVLGGPTGSGKSRILQELGRGGEQVVDLEQLAAHRGSVLGGLSDLQQPTQKMFESRLAEVLARCGADRPTFIEAESAHIGRLRLPEALIGAMRGAPCVCIEASRTTRAHHLLEEYTDQMAEPAALAQRLAQLTAIRGHKMVAHWQDLIAAGAWEDLVQSLLAEHYDPLYQRSQRRDFAHYASAAAVPAADLSAAAWPHLARQVSLAAAAMLCSRPANT
ncbi:MAG: tRNA 2-selenouridine(34) synthase MnmH [Rhodocyclaceae bacterium]|nr:tRNA 2-selenouridine(34) synthase MnmH [Rhodocyclaceae bacterium]MBX3670291.1 tRNA 2-selenouridine(34) synthase MnmH [Rhodocyclaceae bacterium]